MFTLNTGRFYADWWASPTEAHVRVFKDGKLDSAVIFRKTGDPTSSATLVPGRIYTTEYNVSPSALVLRVVELCKKEGFPQHRLSIKVPLIV